MKLKNTLQNLINFFAIGGNNMTATTTNTTRTPNYTSVMVNEMVSTYTAKPTLSTVEQLAASMGKNKRSIIAKLVREGVYVAQPRQTKSGAPIIRKAELVSTIQSHFGISAPSLEKASKSDLQTIVDAINA